jgi:predicted nucleic acid-binding protein
VNKAITDTGPPLHLNQIGYIRLLGIFETIVLTGQVREELQEFSTWYSFKQEEAIRSQEETVNDDEITNEKNRWKDHRLQMADLSVLFLVHRIVNALTLTDDLELRRAIESLGRVVVGSVGVLIRGYKMQRLNRDELHNCVDLIFNDSSLYLSRAFRVRVLKLIEELERK